MKIIQLMPSIVVGDAVSNDARAIRDLLIKKGYITNIYAKLIDGRLPAFTALPIKKLPAIQKEDIVIYHLSIGTAMSDLFAEWDCRKFLIYHNITPPEFFKGYSYSGQTLCAKGYEQAEKLVSLVDYCMSDSKYNQQELQRMGYQGAMGVCPVLIPFSDYEKQPDGATMKKYQDGKINVMFCGRVAPNKKQEDVIDAFAAFHKREPESRLLLVGSTDGMEMYAEELKDKIESLGLQKSVVMTGSVPFSKILAFYRVADIFLCRSAHEGFCVPLVEAMWFDVPVIAYDSSAVAETLGDSGVQIQSTDAEEYADAMAKLMSDRRYRDQILASQRERLKDFSYKRVSEEFMKQFEAFLSTEGDTQI